LVADDDAAIRDLIRIYLDGSGYEVHMARDGVEASMRAVELQPHAMILDINMPRMDGFGVLQTLRPSSSGRSLPILVLTARHAADDVRKAVSLGARDYLTKPFTRPQLLARVARLMRTPALAGLAKAG
jgi:two-component system OmpR family response regulator